VLASAESEESFAEKISKAVKEKTAFRLRPMPTQKQHNEQAERVGRRYRGLQGREHTKGD
jgi:hypothetical protein